MARASAWPGPPERSWTDAMATMTETAPPARLKIRYLEEIRPALMERFGYSTVMQAPKLVKITLNMGVGLPNPNSKALKAPTDPLPTLAAHHPTMPPPPTPIPA